MIKIAPSILSADFRKLEKEIVSVEEAGADLIHIDVMDGHFVPNITIGPCVIEQIKKHSSAPLDVHLMIDNPEKHIEAFVKAGADILTFHLEATNFSFRLLKYIKSYGIKAGISIVPSTPASMLEPLIDEVDLVLVMTVDPGFAGQSFIHTQLEKIAQIHQMIKKTKKDILLAVDGGINDHTIQTVISNGANFIIAGSHIFNNGHNLESYHQKISSLRK